MKKINYLSFLIIIILSLSISYSVLAENKDGDGKHKKQSLQKPTDNPTQSIIDINNITSWVGQDGYHDWLVGGSWNGAFPNGVVAGAIFSEGIVWGGKVNDGNSPVVRVNGNTYGTGCRPITRLFRVRPDYATGNLTQDAADFLNIAVGAVTESDIAGLRAQYATDWNEWPADEGAIYKDVDGDGSYDPTIDIPGVPGASQTIFIKYDDNQVPLYGSPAIGLEVSETYWAYAYSGALGNVIYKKVDIVYKGTPTSAPNSNIQDMYIVQWADPDVGNSTDDFAGCDTTLNLGYAYSSTDPDAVYQSLGLAPPAVGYDFLQGVSKFTGNPNDSAIFNLQWRHGYKYVNVKPWDDTPIPMSSYVYFAAGGTWGDPAFTYTGTLEFYNLMRGFKPDPPYPAAEPFPATVADVVNYGSFTGTFLLTGDPVAGTGKLDGSVDAPGDRRIMVTNGPISMALGDTAEVVIALVGGLGTDHLSSVTQMKINDETAQKVFDLLFKLPSMPPPDVQAVALDKRIVLNWGNDLNSVNDIETFSGQGYDFQGYEVYQLPTASSAIENGVLLGVYDLVDGVTAIYDTVKDANGTNIPVLSVNGKDAGIQRFYATMTDKINNTAFRNGQEYYFAVVPYAYNPAPLLPFHALRAPLVIQTIVPQQTVGVRYGGVQGDTIMAVHATGGGDGSAFAIVVDPTRTTGDSYKISFDTTGGYTSWMLTDETTGEIKTSDQTNQSGDNDYPLIDGLLIKVTGPPLQGKDYTFETPDPPNISPIGLQIDPTYEGDRWFSGDEANGGELLFGAIFLEPNFWGETSLGQAEYNSVAIKWRPMASYTDLNSNGTFDIGEPYVVDDTTLTQKAFMYQTFSGSAYEGFFNIPFSAWDVDDPASPRQLNVVVRDRDANYQWDIHHLTDPPDPLLPNNGDQQYNYTWILHTNYDASGTYYGDGTGTSIDFFSYDNGNGIWDAEWAMWLYPRGSRPMLGAECTLTLVPNRVNSLEDSFTFTAPENSSGTNLVQEDVKKINVFPNPYYGYQYREVSRDNHYVTFSHLPDKATLRIFDLSGVLVKTIEHVASSGQFDFWNLQNENGYPVASGIYIVYIDMPDVGTTKILKLAVIQEQQILRVY